MLYAVAYPEPAKGGRGKKNSSVSEGFSDTRLSYARTVLREAPDLAEGVLSGSLALDSAYKEVMMRLGRLKAQDSRMKDLEHSGISIRYRLQQVATLQRLRRQSSPSIPATA